MRKAALWTALGIISFVACGGGSDSAVPGDGQTGNGPGSDGGSSTVTPPGSDGGSSSPTGDSGSSTTTDGSTPNTDGAAPAKGITTIFTVLFENHDYAEIVGNSAAPYFNSLIKDYGLATNYHDSGVHPSLPNYLVLISGAPQYAGFVDLNPTDYPFPVKQPHLGTQMQAKNVPWRSYQESMVTACNLSPASPYAPKHDPFLYFDDIQNDGNGLCANTNVDYSKFPADLAAGTYKYSFITPNLTNDGHDGNYKTAVTTSDTWASVEIEKIKASAAYQNGGVIFITWDEAEGRNGDSTSQVPMIVVSEQIKTKGFKTNTKYSHKSYLATVEDILGLPRLDTVKNEPNMMEFFR